MGHAFGFAGGSEVNTISVTSFGLGRNRAKSAGSPAASHARAAKTPNQAFLATFRARREHSAAIAPHGIPPHHRWIIKAAKRFRHQCELDLGQIQHLRYFAIAMHRCDEATHDANPGCAR